MKVYYLLNTSFKNNSLNYKMFKFKDTLNILDPLDSSTLKSICLFKNIKTKFRNRYKLIGVIITHDAAQCIQRSLRVKLMKYNICPITHDFLKYPFVSIRHPNGHFNYYSLDGLCHWFIKNKEYTCPNTRFILSTEKVIEIDNMYYYYRRKRFLSTPKKYTDLDISFVGTYLLNFTIGLENMRIITKEIIDDIIVPIYLNNLYFIMDKNMPYGLLIISTVMNLIKDETIQEKEYLLERINTLFSLN